MKNLAKYHDPARTSGCHDEPSLGCAVAEDDSVPCMRRLLAYKAQCMLISYSGQAMVDTCKLPHPLRNWVAISDPNSIPPFTGPSIKLM